MATSEEVMHFIKTQLKLSEIDEDSAMGQVRGWDSLGHVALITAMEDEYKIDIPADMIGELGSVEDIIEFLDEEGIMN